VSPGLATNRPSGSTATNDPVWSPDGTKILAGREFLHDDGTFRSGFVLVDADGSDLPWILPAAHDEHLAEHLWFEELNDVVLVGWS